MYEIIFIQKKNKDEEAKYGIYFDDDYNYLQHLKECQSNDFVLLPASTNYDKEKVNTSING